MLGTRQFACLGVGLGLQNIHISPLFASEGKVDTDLVCTLCPVRFFHKYRHFCGGAGIDTTKHETWLFDTGIEKYKSESKALTTELRSGGQ